MPQLDYHGNLLLARNMKPSLERPSEASPSDMGSAASSHQRSQMKRLFLLWQRVEEASVLLYEDLEQTLSTIEADAHTCPDEQLHAIREASAQNREEVIVLALDALLLPLINSLEALRFGDQQWKTILLAQASEILRHRQQESNQPKPVAISPETESADHPGHSRSLAALLAGK